LFIAEINIYKTKEGFDLLKEFNYFYMVS